MDLIITNDKKQILLGKRNNRPAKHFWFVPGGRINKGEKLIDAIARISEREIGFAINPDDSVFLGPFEHFYNDCFMGDLGIETHYVVLAYRINMVSYPSFFETDDQHEELTWWGYDEALSDISVHKNTRNYIVYIKDIEG